MRFRQLLVGTVYRKRKPTDYMTSDRRQAQAFSIIFDDGEETENLSVTEDVYNIINERESYLFETESNTAYGNKIRVVRVIHSFGDRNVSPDELTDTLSAALLKLTKSGVTPDSSDSMNAISDKPVTKSSGK